MFLHGIIYKNEYDTNMNTMKQAPVFSSFKINNLKLKNRFVMAAAADHLYNDLEARKARFARLAAGDIGLIISGATRLNNIDSWKEVVDAVHQQNGKIALQLVTESGPGVSPWSEADKDMIAVSVLAEDSPYFNPIVQHGKHHAATEEELKHIINIYAQAAVKVKEIGADAIEIHAAHQNFLSQMLSPITNKRTDKWGGSIENRTRMHCEVIKAIRAKIGEDFPVIIKLGIQDGIANGLQFKEGKIAAQIVAEAGYDAIEISQGLQDLSSESWDGTPMRSNIKGPEDEAYFRDWARAIKQLIAKPVILNGGIRSYEVSEDIINSKDADLR